MLPPTEKPTRGPHGFGSALMSCTVRILCENLEDLSLVFRITSHKLFLELLRDEDRKVLMDHMRTVSQRQPERQTSAVFLRQQVQSRVSCCSFRFCPHV
ncbi:hypothetical protein AMECASPLE_034085 [Ameca splendens]|uniref:Uncharacterized protein n=1 Tax=Ameca splendens TaxID=208324 RepID=A0ABV1ADF5_9TELE